MGMLGKMFDRTSAFFNDPGAMSGLAYLQARRMGADPLEAMLMKQQMDEERARTALYAQRDAREEEEYQRKRTAEEDASKRQTATDAVVNAYADPRYKAVVESNPQVFKSYLGSLGGLEQAQQAGMFPDPNANRKSIGQITENGITYYVERDAQGNIIKTPVGRGDREGGEEAYGVSPIEVIGPNGERKLIQLSNKGGAREVQFPEGYTPAEPYTKVDAGNEIILLDKVTGTPLARIPKQIPPQSTPQAAAAVVTAQETAKEQVAQEAQAKKDAPKLSDAVGLIQEMQNDAGRISAYGSIRGITPSVRQATVDFEAKRDRMVFILGLAARGELKGTGQISDYESRMLLNAQSILANPRISPGAALQEMKRIESWLQAKEAEARARSGQSSVDDLVNKYGN